MATRGKVVVTRDYFFIIVNFPELKETLYLVRVRGVYCFISALILLTLSFIFLVRSKCQVFSAAALGELGKSDFLFN